MRTVSIKGAYELMRIYLLAGLVPFLKSKPGVGKSSIVKQFADENKLYLIDIRLAQCDPTDLNGFPAINKETEKAYYVPMDMFPLEDDPIPEGYVGWLLFFDELNGADRGVQKASYKVILDKGVGTNKIHSKVFMVAAGNNDTDNALVEELSSALQSRLAHIQVITSAPDWLPHAREYDFAHEVVSFIEWLPQSLNTFDPDMQGEEPTYPCERTWEMVSKLLTPTKIMPALQPSHPLALEAIAGIIGEGKAIEFLGYLKIFEDLPTVAAIIAAPNTVPLPNAPGTMYALTGIIGHAATADNISQLIKYANRMAKEYQVITLRCLAAKNPQLIQTTAVKDWIAENNTQLFAA